MQDEPTINGRALSPETQEHGRDHRHRAQWEVQELVIRMASSQAAAERARQHAEEMAKRLEELTKRLEHMTQLAFFRAVKPRGLTIAEQKKANRAAYDPARLKRFIKQLGYTQNEFAREVGTTSGNVSKWVNGCPPGPEFVSPMAALAAIRGVVFDLFGEPDKESGTHPLVGELPGADSESRENSEGREAGFNL